MKGHRPARHSASAMPDRARPSDGSRCSPSIRAHVLISIHGPNETRSRLDGRVAGRRGRCARWLQGLGRRLAGRASNQRQEEPRGSFRLSRQPRPAANCRRANSTLTSLRHRAGELVLGYLNDAKFNRWDDGLADPRIVAQFFRNGSFAVLRKIEQNEEAFNNYLNEQARALSGVTGGLSESEALRTLAERRAGHAWARLLRVRSRARRSPERRFQLHGRHAGLRLPVRRTHPPHQPARAIRSRLRGCAHCFAAACLMARNTATKRSTRNAA